MRFGRFVAEVFRAFFRMWLVLFLLVLLLVIAYFWADIDPTREYGFGGGVLHGFFGIQNLILFCFTDREVWAPTNTGRGYTWGFYAGVFLLPAIVRNIIRVIYYAVRESLRPPD